MKISPFVLVRQNTQCRFGIAVGAAALLASLGVLSAHLKLLARSGVLERSPQ